MTTPRRRVLRPTSPLAAEIDRRHALALRRSEASLAKDKTAWRRWMRRLKRSFNEVIRLQERIARLEKQVTLLRQT